MKCYVPGIYKTVRRNWKIIEWELVHPIFLSLATGNDVDHVESFAVLDDKLLSP